jgi:hypothetical protein
MGLLPHLYGPQEAHGAVSNQQKCLFVGKTNEGQVYH